MYSDIYQPLCAVSYALPVVPNIRTTRAVLEGFLGDLGKGRHFPSNHAEAKALIEVSVHTQCVSDKNALFLAVTQLKTNDGWRRNLIW